MNWKPIFRYGFLIMCFLIIAIGVAMIFAGCSAGGGYSGTNFDVRTVEVDGRMVTCIVARSGISCDW